MKCKAIVKSAKKGEKNTICNTELHPSQIYCHICGTPTDALKTRLSAWQNYRHTVAQFKNDYARYLGLGIALTIYSLIIAAVLIFCNINYWSTNLILFAALPLLLIPFALQNEFNIRQYINLLKTRPVTILYYFLFSLIAVIYFFLLKVICTGFLLNIMVDPVLHIVRLIMVFYGISCALIAPVVIADDNKDPFSAIYDSIKAGHEPRWQLFLTSIIVFVINVIGTLCFLFGLIFSLPLSYLIIRNYYLRMKNHHLFISANPKLADFQEQTEA